MTYKIPLVKNTFFKDSKTKREIINFIKKEKKLSMGEECKKFEHNFSEFQNSKFSVFFSSGSAANLALIQSLKNLGILKNGDNVAISGLTWSTNVMPLIQHNMNPIPIDVKIDNLNINLDSFEESFKKYKFSSVFLTNALGFTCDLERLKNFCQKNSILLIQDSCESLGTTYKGLKTNDYSFADTFSFFVGHQMSTIEGGMVVTHNEDLYEMLKLVRAHGWSRDSKNFIDEDFYSKFTFKDLAYNLRPQEINGVIGNFQIKLLKENLDKRFKIFNQLSAALNNKKTVFKLNPQNDFYAPFSFPLVFKDERDCIEIKKVFKENLVEIRPIISGNVSTQPFFKKYVSQKFNLENCELVHKNGFYFGINPDLTKNEISFILRLLKSIK